jgi:DegV family protein with EDD domain
MAIKIVTDSSADVPAKLVKELGITVVPLYVRFGEEVLRMGVDISDKDYYNRLLHGTVHPSTIQPPPQDFVKVYQGLSSDADGIVSIHLSSELSGTYNSAVQAKKEMAGNKCPIEVIDTRQVTLSLGLIVTSAAGVARAGGSLKQVVEEVKQGMKDTHMLGLLDTLRYLYLGGRIGKAKQLLGSVLNVKPVLTVKDGVVVPTGQVRTRPKGVARLIEFARSARNIKQLWVGYNTTPDEAQTLADSLGSVFDRKMIQIAEIGAVLGVHAGPGTLIVSFRGDLKE